MSAVAGAIGLRAAARPRTRPRLLGELVVVLVLVRVYDLVRAQAAVRAEPARRNGEGLLSAEHLLRLDWEAAANRWLTGHHGLSRAAAYWYQFAHLSVTLSVLAICYLVRPALYRPARNALVGTNVVGMAVFFLYPVMPPRLLPGHDFVDSVAGAGFGTTHGGPVPANQFAAMPSLHLAWAMWTGLVVAALLRGTRANRGLRLLGPCYVALMAVVVVVTANHFLLDVVAGIAVALLCWSRMVSAKSPDQPLSGRTVKRRPLRAGTCDDRESSRG
jgi:membrane-associated phospholipid phosphatase